jgi:TIR domain
LDSIEIFISYASEDEILLKELVKHLASLNRQGLANTWYDNKIAPGVHKQAEIDKHLNSAQIILLLVSADFLASDYCYSIEMQHAIERHQRAEARVIPTLLRPVYWQGTPLAQFSMLPQGAIPITSYEDQDQALLEVVVGIAKVAREDFLHNIDISPSPPNFPRKPIPIASMYVPSRVGNRGVASFLLNGKEHVLHYTRIDGFVNAFQEKSLRSLKNQVILLTYNQQELVREEVPEFVPLKTIVKQHKFQIEGVDCLFTFKMRVLAGIMSIRIEVGGVVVFSH